MMPRGELAVGHDQPGGSAAQDHLPRRGHRLAAALRGDGIWDFGGRGVIEGRVRAAFIVEAEEAGELEGEAENLRMRVQQRADRVLLARDRLAVRRLDLVVLQVGTEPVLRTELGGDPFLRRVEQDIVVGVNKYGSTEDAAANIILPTTFQRGGRPCSCRSIPTTRSRAIPRRTSGSKRRWSTPSTPSASDGSKGAYSLPLPRMTSANWL